MASVAFVRHNESMVGIVLLVFLYSKQCHLTHAQLGSGGSHILLGGGGGRPRIRPRVISQTTGPIFKIETPFDK